VPGREGGARVTRLTVGTSHREHRREAASAPYNAAGGVKRWALAGVPGAYGGPYAMEPPVRIPQTAPQRCPLGRRRQHPALLQNLVARFIAVCSASILAEALCLSSPFSGQSRAKRSVSQKRTSRLRDELQPSTNSDKLSDPGKRHSIEYPCRDRTTAYGGMAGCGRMGMHATT
jgi:hypothetical protein